MCWRLNITCKTDGCPNTVGSDVFTCLPMRQADYCQNHGLTEGVEIDPHSPARILHSTDTRLRPSCCTLCESCKAKAKEEARGKELK